MKETKELARFAGALSYKDLPDNVIEKTKELILDQLGCQLAGSTLPWIKPAYEYALDYRAKREESTIVNYGLKTGPQDAAFVNGSFGHSFLGDDTDSVCYAHFGSIIIPAVVAMGEREMISGRDLIKAVVLGYEVASRIGAAAPFAMERGFHPGPIFGPFGVAAACGSILGFGESQILDALGIAGSHSSGLMEYSISGGTINQLHSGMAAYNGIRAALLAQKGFKGPPTIVEGKKGFLQAFSDGYLPDKITDGLGEKFRVSLIGLKSYCCCGTSSTTLDAVSQIMDEHQIPAEEIKEIMLYVTPKTFRMTGSIVEPNDITSARFSGRFAVALRCIKGGNTFKEYCEENLRDPEVLELTRKTQCILDDGIGTLEHGQNPARVIISLKNGISYEHKVNAAKGSILNPMKKGEVYGKFRQFASAALDQHNVEAICETVGALDSLNSIDGLIRLLVSPDPT
jgi:2-methylcitrate dehydratase PrpD